MPRADARRNVDAILAAANQEFTEHGVDVSVRAIAARAGVGTATIYRHFPSRADLIVEVSRHEIEDCASAGVAFAQSLGPWEALRRWTERYTRLVATKHGLAGVLHSDDPAYAGLHEYFEEQVAPVLRGLLDRAERAGAIGGGISESDLIGAIASLCIPPPGSRDTSRATRLVGLLLDGLRYHAPAGHGSAHEARR